ncbi:hypothetical protein C8R43DRAFT_1243512 [Mycena crocata]|nr:hypothetical protein C8R43DRAFT_1243512 [Mycena crocata]
MSSATRATDRAHIAEIDAQVRDLQESICLLQTQRKVFQDRLDAYKYPVLTLPNEITSEIFVHFLPPYPSCPPMEQGLLPFLLTHICRAWRNIALATPTLWRAIRLVTTCHKFDNEIDLLQSWLMRTGSCPLSIQVDSSEVGPYAQPEIIQALTPHCSRWEYLELHSFVPEMLSSFCGETPLLRHLRLSLYGPPSSPFGFNRAPLLRSAVLADNASSSVILPWQQLTSLTLDRVRPYNCTRMLQQARNLLHCEVVLTENDSDEEGNVELPRLQFLRLDAFEDEAEGLGPINSMEYLRRFITPALQRLEVVDGSYPIPPLASFISSSGCKLQELQISVKETTPKDTYRNAFPSIPKISFTTITKMSDY